MENRDSLHDNGSRLLRASLVGAALIGVLVLAVLSGRPSASSPAVEPITPTEKALPRPTPTEPAEEEFILLPDPTARAAAHVIAPASRAQPAGTPRPTAKAKTASAPRITAIGDSILLSAADDLSQLVSDITIDAAYGRQVRSAIEVIRARRAAGLLGEIVVIHIGSNGTFTEAEFEEMMALLKGVPRIVFINLKVPRVWQDSNNLVLAEGAARYPNVELIDWHGVSVNRSELFYEDGVHLRPEGSKVYAEMIAGYLEAH